MLSSAIADVASDGAAGVQAMVDAIGRRGAVSARGVTVGAR